MKLISIIFFLSSLCSNLIAQEFYSEHFTVERLSKGVYAVINKPGGYAICNSGIIDLGDETLIFDCFISPDAAEDLNKAAEELTGNKVNYVVNSHFHNDHIRGNQVFTDAEIISTQRTKELIEETEPEELEWEKSVVDQRIEASLKSISENNDALKLEEDKMWLGYYNAIKESFNDYKITLPNVFLTDSIIIRGSEREARIFTKGNGHTESDIVLWLPKEKILFAGDLLFVDCHPWLGDGYIDKWINYLNNLKKLEAQHIVPGHGSLGSNQQIDQMINYIQKIESIVDEAVKNNLSEVELKSITIPEEYKNWWFSRFFTPNLTLLFRKQTGPVENK